MSSAEARQSGPTWSTPIVFVSYSWDSNPHMEWVRRHFTNGLRSRGVRAVTDVHETEYGDLLDDFMERIAANCDHIAVICTPRYADRARRSKGGVGYEKELIRRFMDKDRPANRVVPILRDGDGNSIPPFLAASRRYVDMRDNARFEDLLDELAALFYGQQIYKAPPVSEPPNWLKELMEE
ncbi:toll/interleukin-1 receptor domain-containing protein [Streptomyces mauvecolor]|uniref:Toll/interleukin-1 receptor domain-containing protein n=1 Tax=Streptomyces mauvecolor TaxID=58345 RepID=A0ABV9UWF0_9ACTN